MMRGDIVRIEIPISGMTCSGCKAGYGNLYVRRRLQEGPKLYVGEAAGRALGIWDALRHHFGVSRRTQSEQRQIVKPTTTLQEEQL